MANNSFKKENVETSIKSHKLTSRSVNGKKNSLTSFGFNRSSSKDKNEKSVSISKEKSCQKKFSGDGISFKGKLIGVDPVTSPSGDKMCQEAMQRLKTIIKETGYHKQRIIIQISLNGIKISDEKKGELVSHHPIPLISYISRDVTDYRAFGFVYGSPESGHQFIGIKTEKCAVPIMRTIGELFSYVYELKTKQKLNAINFNNEEVIDKFSNTSNNNRKEKPPPLPPPRDDSSIKNTYDTSAPFGDLFLDMSSIRHVIDSVKEASDPYANWESFNDDLNQKQNSFHSFDSSNSTQFLNNLVKIEPPSSLSRKPKTKFKNQENFDILDNAFEEKQEKAETHSNNQVSTQKDRYAAFSEINSMTSIFDSFTSNQDSNPEFANFEKNFDNLKQNSKEKKKLFNGFDSNHHHSFFFDQVSSLSSLSADDKSPTSVFPTPISKPSHQTDSEKSFDQFEMSIFADLDPLKVDKEKPIIDKNKFFQDIKKPFLKDLQNSKDLSKNFEGSINLPHQNDNFVLSSNTSPLDKNNVGYSLATSSSLNLQDVRSCSASDAFRNPFISDSPSESSDDLFTNSPSDNLTLPVPPANVTLNNNIINNDSNNQNLANLKSLSAFDLNRSSFFPEYKPLSFSSSTSNSKTNESFFEASFCSGNAWSSKDSKSQAPLLSNSSSPISSSTTTPIPNPFFDSDDSVPPAPPPRPPPRESLSVIPGASSTLSDTPPPPVPPRPSRNDAFFSAFEIPQPPLAKRNLNFNSNQAIVNPFSNLTNLTFSIQSSQNTFAPPLPLPQRKTLQTMRSYLKKELSNSNPSNSWQSQSKSLDSQDLDPFNCAFVNQDIDSFKTKESLNLNNSSSNINTINIAKGRATTQEPLSVIRINSQDLDKHSTPKENHEAKFNFQDFSQLSTIATIANQDLTSTDFSFSTPEQSSVFDSTKDSKEEFKSINALNNSEKASAKIKNDPFEDDFFQ